MNSKYLSTLWHKYNINPSKQKEFLNKLISNFYWHLTPTEVQVHRMQTVLDSFSIKGTFFVTANLLENHPERAEILRTHEVGIHGYTHLDYGRMTFLEAVDDMTRAVKAFQKQNLPIRFFRAPYATPHLADGQSWYKALQTTGLNYSSSQLIVKPPFHPFQTPEGLFEFPVIYPTDDALISYYGLKDSRSMTKELLKTIYRTKKSKDAMTIGGNILIFCLHPLRIGQSKYLPILDALLRSVEKMQDFELCNFSDSINRWHDGDKTNLVVITGDIDCWTFNDYIRRMQLF